MEVRTAPGAPVPALIQAREEKAEPAATRLAPRKIVRTATVELVVEDFDSAEQTFKQLLTLHKDAYIAQADVKGSAGSPRHGLWRLRVPAPEFDGFVTALTRLGIPRKSAIDTQEVTEEFYDLEARIKNKKVEETRLLAHLEKSTGKLEEILTVEREISRVRGEIEQQEGRLRLLANVTSLATITLSIQEIKDYVPPQTPSFGQTVRTTFFASVDILAGIGRAAILAAVAVTPWLPLAVVLALPVFLYRRRLGIPART
jgi:hypothetical protein